MISDNNSLERLNFKFDANESQKYLSELIERFSPVKRGQCYHGWSLLSDDGQWQSGFHEGSNVYNQNGDFNNLTWKKNNYTPDTHFKKPTEACFGYGAHILRVLSKKGFKPRRARILGLLSGQATKWHHDHRPDAYWPRLHIPITTNSNCNIRINNSSHHMAADGSVYLLDTSALHMAENLGATIRYHLVIQAWDTKLISKKFKYYLPEISNFTLKKDNVPQNIK